MTARHVPVDTSHDGPPPGRDTRAAFTGFLLGALALLGILSTIVKVTNAHYERLEAAAQAAQPKS